MSDESKDVEDEVADRGKFINSTRTTMYSHPCLERMKQKSLGISSIEQFVMILSRKFNVCTKQRGFNNERNKNVLFPTFGSPVDHKDTV